MFSAFVWFLAGSEMILIGSSYSFWHVCSAVTNYLFTILHVWQIAVHQELFWSLCRSCRSSSLSFIAAVNNLHVCESVRCETSWAQSLKFCCSTCRVELAEAASSPGFPVTSKCFYSGQRCVGVFCGVLPHSTRGNTTERAFSAQLEEKESGYDWKIDKWQSRKAEIENYCKNWTMITVTLLQISVDWKRITERGSKWKR